MKFSTTILACFLVVSCNPDEYFDMNTVISGSDAHCSVATTQSMCDQLPKCQSAYEDVETDLEAPIFAACIANPEPGVEVDPDGEEILPPTIEDVIANGCENIDHQYLYVKTITEKKGSKSKSSRQVKVKVCHQTGNISAHTIIIACPAVKSHRDHHDDYVGSCSNL